ncbi:MAG: endolytic transglycosylase MltG [Muribaculaceae bacterium]|nr:endolytic transglycosylase MltG [Muribaculaceae bacterium]
MKKKHKIALIILCAVIITGGICGVSLLRFVNISSPTSAMIYIYPGTTTSILKDSIAAKTDEKYGMRIATILSILNRNKSLRSGAYKITEGDKALTIAKRIKNGEQTPVNITFNNIRTIDEFAERVSAGLRISADELKMAATDSAFLASMNITINELPGVLLPDTYNVYWTITPGKLMEKLKTSYNNFWNEARRRKAANKRLSPIEVAILASIVEEETNDISERQIVARLYMNRLNRGMMLQADPTVKFALGDFGRKRILNVDLEYDSPYNTYKYAGLPPGPIRIAEKSTIDAVLNAPRNNYLYMCAKEDFSGKHNFATNLAEHNANAAKYRQALNRRGIKK